MVGNNRCLNSGAYFFKKRSLLACFLKFTIKKRNRITRDIVDFRKICYIPFSYYNGNHVLFFKGDGEITDLLFIVLEKITESHGDN